MVNNTHFLKKYLAGSNIAPRKSTISLNTLFNRIRMNKPTTLILQLFKRSLFHSKLSSDYINVAKNKQDIFGKKMLKLCRMQTVFLWRENRYKTRKAYEKIVYLLT